VAEVKHKEGRHVGLDFYDLLIEALMEKQVLVFMDPVQVFWRSRSHY